MISVAHTLNLYEVVNKYFRNTEDSKVFVSEVINVVNTQVKSDANDFATKGDINLLKTDIHQLESEIAEVRADVSKLEIKMGEGFKDILKWMIALMVAFASLIITFIKFLP